MTFRMITILCALLFFALVGSNLWWAFHDLTSCNDFLYHEEVSPDGKTGAFLLYSNCGATTPFTTMVFLAPAEKRFSQSGRRPFLVVKELENLKVRWKSNRQIEVTLPKEKKIYRHESQIDGVSIIYN